MPERGHEPDEPTAVKRVPVRRSPALHVGAEGDAAEREADHVADIVLRRLTAPSANRQLPTASRDTRIRRRGSGSDQAEVGPEGGGLSDDLAGQIGRSSGRGAPLEPAVRGPMEQAFGTSFAGVTVHRESRIAPRIGAAAFTHGSDIHFAPGAYSTRGEGLHTIAHELAHTVQQSGQVGRVVRRKLDKHTDHTQTVESIERALRLIRDYRFTSASREVAYVPDSANFSTRSAAHGKMGLSALEQAKERAKSVEKTLTKAPVPDATAISQRISTSAGDVYNAFSAARGQIDAKYTVDLARIGAKAVEALKTGLTTEVLQAEPKVQEIFGQGRDKDADLISAGKARVNELIASGDFATSGFHGTSSPILSGLETGGGELLSMAELKKKSIAQTTGEGDTLSAAAGIKDTISIGMGESGLGTSAVYAALGLKVTHYNSTLYTYDELVDEIHKLDLLSNIANIKPGEVAVDDLMEAAERIGVPPSGLATMMQRVTPDSAKSLKKRLEDELAIRNKFPKGNPRREGGATNATTYPILFEFSIDPSEGGVAATPAGPLPGEGYVNTRISLATTLRRAWCPAAKVAALTKSLKRILPDTDFEVLPLEALQALPRAPGRGGEVLWSTFDKMKGEAAKMETARDLLVSVLDDA